MAGNAPFLHLSAEELDQAAQRHGFKRKGQRNWVRRTQDFVQLVNLQRSQWSAEDRYLNFALWPLAMGEPPTIAESKFHFRTRGERMGPDLTAVFSVADTLTTLAEFAKAEKSGRISGAVTKQLRALLPSGD